MPDFDKSTMLHQDKECLDCGTKFNTGSYYYKKFCSTKCRIRWFRKKQALKINENNVDK